MWFTNDVEKLGLGVEVDKFNNGRHESQIVSIPETETKIFFRPLSLDLGQIYWRRKFKNILLRLVLTLVLRC